MDKRTGWNENEASLVERQSPIDWAEQDDYDDDSFLCECQLEAMEDEDASNCCSACGKPLR